MTTHRHRTVHALVLRSTDVGETSRLVTLFTAQHGRLTVKARGVRSAKSRDAAVLEPFNVIEAKVVMREGTEIHPFAEGTVVTSNAAIRADVMRAAVASVWLELLDQVDCDPSDAPTALSWARQALDALSGAEDARSLGLLLAWQLIAILGHQPVLDRCVDTGAKPKPPLKFSLRLGGLVSDPAALKEDPVVVGLDVELGRLLFRVPRLSAAELADMRLTHAQAKRLADLLGRLCQFHLELKLRSLRFLESLEIRQ